MLTFLKILSTWEFIFSLLSIIPPRYSKESTLDRFLFYICTLRVVGVFLFVIHMCLVLLMLRFDFTISHVPEKSLMTADTLSRAPLDKGPIDSDKRDERRKEDELRKEAEAYVRAILIYLPASDSFLDEIRSELKKDEILKVVIHHVEHGWPEKQRDVYGQMAKFWNERGNLTVHEGLLLRGKQIVIPSSLRMDVLRHLHDGHQGITKTRENANSSVWWPGLSKDIEKTVKNCVVCA